MIQATHKMDIVPQKIDDALQILRSIIERTRAETGCISCSVYQDTESEHVIVLEEKWRSDEDLQRHLRSDDYRKVLLVMEMACKPPEISFDTINESMGVEFIEKARTEEDK
jgi:quinol monooxygenase YgiN